MLIILLETNPLFWESPKGRSFGCAAANGLEATLRQLMVFINGYLSLNQQNRVAVIAMHSDGCHYLYVSPAEEDNDGGLDAEYLGFTNNVGGLEPIQSDACTRILERLSTLTPGHARNMDGSDSPAEAVLTRTHVTTPLAAAMSMAICYCNRLQTRGNSVISVPRILCLQGSEDSASQYIPMMNAIFSAQRVGIPIDSCLLGCDDSAFLQQAAHITGGLYYKPRRGDTLVQHLLSVSSADQYSRRFLQLPNQRGVDFRASCFCHKRPVDTGFVCSVCLSIFCEDRVLCPTCGASFSATLLDSGAASTFEPTS
mmetsp:Transcript_8198/g.20720  ORF Transcript_8198/g.20720 Transcript_8198/m.20720 type:complete len:312 (+) Transcript_8198:269-1204(+)